MKKSLKQKKTEQAIQKLAKEAAELSAVLDAIKPVYNRLDLITEAFVELGVKQIKVGDTEISLVDNFYDKNKFFKTTSIKRFELKTKKVG